MIKHYEKRNRSAGHDGAKDIYGNRVVNLGVVKLRNLHNACGGRRRRCQEGYQKYLLCIGNIDKEKRELIFLIKEDLGIGRANEVEQSTTATDKDVMRSNWGV